MTSYEVQVLLSFIYFLSCAASRIFCQFLWRDQEPSSHQFSCTSLRDLNSGRFTDWATVAAAGQSKLINKVVSLKLFNDCDVRFNERNKKSFLCLMETRTNVFQDLQIEVSKNFFFHKIGSNFFFSGDLFCQLSFCYCDVKKVQCQLAESRWTKSKVAQQSFEWQ